MVVARLEHRLCTMASMVHTVLMVIWRIPETCVQITSLVQLLVEQHGHGAVKQPAIIGVSDISSTGC